MYVFVNFYWLTERQYKTRDFCRYDIAMILNVRMFHIAYWSLNLCVSSYQRYCVLFALNLKIKTSLGETYLANHSNTVAA